MFQWARTHRDNCLQQDRGQVGRPQAWLNQTLRKTRDTVRPKTRPALAQTLTMARTNLSQRTSSSKDLTFCRLRLSLHLPTRPPKTSERETDSQTLTQDKDSRRQAAFSSPVTTKLPNQRRPGPRTWPLTRPWRQRPDNRRLTGATTHSMTTKVASLDQGQTIWGDTPWTRRPDRSTVTLEAVRPKVVPPQIPPN